jgi:dihydrofolate reductase
MAGAKAIEGGLFAASGWALTMSKLRIHGFSISLDGYGAGPRQDIDNPLGVGGLSLHEWMVSTKTFRETHGESGGTTGLDDDFVKRGSDGIGAWILGRNMFGPLRGPWTDESWKGWWGDNPPYHTPVFVLTRHPRRPITMDGGTEFVFVDNLDRALKLAVDAAGDKDVRLGGGVSVIRQYLEARAVDEMHLAIAPVLLGSGEHLLAGIELPSLGYEPTEHVPTAAATHVVVTRRR